MTLGGFDTLKCSSSNNVEEDGTGCNMGIWLQAGPDLRKKITYGQHLPTQEHIVLFQHQKVETPLLSGFRLVLKSKTRCPPTS